MTYVVFCSQIDGKPAGREIRRRIRVHRRAPLHDPDVERLIPAEDSSLFPDEEQCAYFPGLVVHASTSALRSCLTWTRGQMKVSLFYFNHRMGKWNDVVFFWVSKKGGREAQPRALRALREAKEVRPGTLLVDWIAQRDV